MSCDLIGITADIVATVRQTIAAETGLSRDRVMLHATHTHSAPAVRAYSGWGDIDPPYLELLPGRLARACLTALTALRDAVISHAEVPCTGIAINRETDLFQAATSEEVLAEDWHPPKPEETDRTCHVLRIDGDGQLLGFLSYYGCHPVIGGPESRKIHGDWPGIATNMIERLYPGSIGLFLQGAQGDINSARVCCAEDESLRMLDVLATRYARFVLHGLTQVTPLEIDVLRTRHHAVTFSRKAWDTEKLNALLAEQNTILHAPDGDDSQQSYRMAMVFRDGLRHMLARQARGETLTPESELHGIRLGPLAFMGSPFEVFRAIKNDVVREAKATIPFVMGFTNDSQGYAQDDVAARKGGYATDTVPFICRQLPFANIHAELVAAYLALDASLQK